MPIKKSQLYSSLWSSCDELRGGMDASQYKDYVLVLLFIKYVSDKYAGQPYAPISIPPGASFKNMVALKGKPDIGDQINKKIIAPLAYNPLAQDVTKEEVGANTETDKQFIYNTYTDLLKDVDAKPNMNKTETYEEWAKGLFTKEPANMKLLVVVDKLLTGFDAPPCTYLYIDKSMQDHGLFQAICRVNRLDGEDKDFGYIVDYKDLFKKVENAIAVYTSELDRSAGGADPEVLVQDRPKKGKERLDNAVEALVLLCEPVEPPKGELEHIHYFCGNTEIPADLQEREPQRAAVYKATVALVRAYANIADELEPAGYKAADVGRIKKQLTHYLNVRQIIRNASGETLDLK